ncbi:MAG: hypothetical protein ACREDT_15765, partial [Methylocella sp.]
ETASALLLLIFKFQTEALPVGRALRDTFAPRSLQAFVSLEFVVCITAAGNYPPPGPGLRRWGLHFASLS